jgi:uncharacterized protein
MRLALLMIAALAVPAIAQPTMLPMPGPAGADGPRHVMIERMMAAPTLLSLSAEAEVARSPDTLRLSAGVVTEAATATDAMAGNAARMNAVVAALKAAGVAARDVQTSSLSLSPQQRYQPNQPPVITGYQARNSVTVKTTKLADAGKLIDALVKAGANEVNGPMFSLTDPESALNEARAAAVAKAQARAAIYAAAAGMVVKRIVSISEAGAEMPGPRPMLRTMAMADGAGEPTPVEPGELRLSAQISVTFELEKKKS